MPVLKGGLFNVGNSFINGGGCMQNTIPSKSSNAITLHLQLKGVPRCSKWSSVYIRTMTSSNFVTGCNVSKLAHICSGITNYNQALPSAESIYCWS